VKPNPPVFNQIHDLWMVKVRFVSSGPFTISCAFDSRSSFLNLISCPDVGVSVVKDNHGRETSRYDVHDRDGARLHELRRMMLQIKVR
jgi:hypothetical protein